MTDKTRFKDYYSTVGIQYHRDLPGTFACLTVAGGSYQVSLFARAASDRFPHIRPLQKQAGELGLIVVTCFVASRPQLAAVAAPLCFWGLSNCVC